ncbi:MAG: uracil-DNA glycosylase family protein [Planctomycetota bacterium]|jgi:DNA polymerase
MVLWTILFDVSISYGHMKVNWWQNTMSVKPKACEGCPAYESGRSFVPPIGPSDARLAIVGQGPGADEAQVGEPFVGAAGKRLNRWLVLAGVPRERIAIGNIVQCHLPGNRPPKAAEIAHCREAHVAPWLESLRALRVIVPAGMPATKEFLGKRAGASTVGTTHPLGDTTHDVGLRYVVPIVHPAAIVRGQWTADPVQPKFLRRAWEIAEANEPPRIADLGKPPPNGYIATRTDEVAYFCGEALRSKDTLYADIEGTGGILIGIGFWSSRRDEGIYIPLRDRAEPFWSEEDTRTVATWLDRVLASPEVGLVFHNGSSFDIPFLEDIGFTVRGYVDDTMVRAWGTYHESAKDLQSLAILYAGLPAWKHLSHVGDEGEGK